MMPASHSNAQLSIVLFRMSLSRGQLIRTTGGDGGGLARHGALLPTKWVPRTGLGWEVEHFLIYFVTTFALCVALRRPFLVASLLLAPLRCCKTSPLIARPV